MGPSHNFYKMERLLSAYGSEEPPKVHPHKLETTANIKKKRRWIQTNYDMD